MRISETPCDANIHLSKFKFNCDEIDTSVPKPLSQSLSHFYLICGRPGSSKTTLCLTMIAKRGKCYNRRFDKVFLWSPSMGSIEDCPLESLPEEQKFEDLTEANLSAVLEDISGSGEKVLFLMDDVVNDMKKDVHLERLLCKTLMNRRHVCGSGGGLSVWITSQVYNKIPLPVRKVASALFLYESKSKAEIDAFYTEVIVGMTKMEWYQLCKYVWDKRFNFLYIDTTKPFNHMYHKMFNQLHLTTEMDHKMAADGM